MYHGDKINTSHVKYNYEWIYILHITLQISRISLDCRRAFSYHWRTETSRHVHNVVRNVHNNSWWFYMVMIYYNRYPSLCLIVTMHFRHMWITIHMHGHSFLIHPQTTVVACANHSGLCGSDYGSSPTWVCNIIMHMVHRYTFMNWLLLPSPGHHAGMSRALGPVWSNVPILYIWCNLTNLYGFK